jgi:hypothetical protein
MICTVTVLRCHWCERPFTWLPGPNPDYLPGKGHMICPKCAAQYEIDCKREEEMYEHYCREGT